MYTSRVIFSIKFGGVGERGRGEKGGGRHLGQHIKAVSVVRMGAFAP